METEYNIFTNRLGAMSERRTQKQFSYGCDGTHHALQTITLYLSDEDFTDPKDLTVEFATLESTEILCKCTAKCKGKESLGWFLHEKEAA